MGCHHVWSISQRDISSNLLATIRANKWGEMVINDVNGIMKLVINSEHEVLILEEILYLLGLEDGLGVHG